MGTTRSLGGFGVEIVGSGSLRERGRRRRGHLYTGETVIG